MKKLIALMVMLSMFTIVACKGEEKKALRVRFDALKARSFDENKSAFERILNEIGVIDRRGATEPKSPSGRCTNNCNRTERATTWILSVSFFPLFFRRLASFCRSALASISG